MVLARVGLGPLRKVRPDVVIDTQNGIPFLARLAYGRRVAVLVHHCHREQWPVAGPAMARFGWFVESRLSPWLHRRNQYVTVSLAVGAGPDRAWREPRPHRGGPQRPRRGACAHADRAAVEHPAGGGAVAAGAAQADRGRAGRHRRAAAADAGAAPRHPRRRLVAAQARQPRRAAGHLRCGDVPRPRRRRDQTPCAARVLGAPAAVAQRGLGPCGDGGRRSIACRPSATAARGA